MTGNVVVVKFGGTSLGTPARMRRAVERILFQRSHRPVIAVVSAMGRATDRIERWLERVSGTADPPHVACRESDRALATGEDLSAALLAAALRRLGVPARSFRGGDAGVRASGPYGDGTIRSVDGIALRGAIAAGVVPVVSGFQGVNGAGETVTLGRGASDFTAVMLAGALGATECHLVTDVAGVFDRDPRRVRAARLLDTLTHDALHRLAAEGASRGTAVIDPRACRAAERYGLRLEVFHYDAPLVDPSGTTVPGPVAAGVQ